MNAPRLVALLSVGGLLVGCGGGRSAPPVKPVAVAKVDLKRAKAPATAVILGTGGAGETTTLTLPTGPQRVTVAPLFVRGDGAEAAGGIGAVELVVQAATSGQVKVGVFEDVAGGAGPEWRAGVWLAAYVAVSVLDKDLTDFSFEATSSGHVDGASASALMSAGLVAAILGWKVDAAATMTGTINPDGTVGPVSGIPQKFGAALAAGKRRLGYPVGQRLAYDAATGAEVDLVALARERGAEAIEVADIYGAIELMTGRALPRPQPLASAAMEVPAEIADRVAARVDAWDKRVDALHEELAARFDDGRGLGGAVGAYLRSTTAHDRAYAQRKQGMVAPAYHGMVAAWIAATASRDAAAVLELASDGDIDGATRELDRLTAELAAATDAVRAVGTRKPATMGDHLQMLSAFDAAIDGWSLQAFAETLTRRTRLRLELLREDADDEYALTSVGRDVVAATNAIARARAAVLLTQDAAEIEAAPSPVYRCSLPAVKRLATSFAAAAGSNLAYVEALGGITSDLGRDLTATTEPDYLVAAVGSRVGDAAGGVPATLKAAWGEDSVGWRLFTLAASQQSYFRSSLLASRWHSLRVRTGLDGRAYAIGNERALLNMLEFAEQRAREHAHAAQVATGQVPLQSQLHYQTARGLRDGDPADKLDALAEYWAASVYAQSALMLARN